MNYKTRCVVRQFQQLSDAAAGGHAYLPELVKTANGLLREVRKRFATRHGDILRSLRTVDSREFIAERLEEIADLLDREAKATVTTAITPASIWSHGEMSYSIDGINPVNVSARADAILQEFLNAQCSRTTKQLSIITGVPYEEVHRIIKQISKKAGEQFAIAVQWPKKKGDGYHIRVRLL